MFFKRAILWYGMVSYGMVWYEISMICYEISMLCFAMVYFVKDKQSATVNVVKDIRLV